MNGLRWSPGRWMMHGVSLALLSLPAALLPTPVWGQGVLSVEVVNAYNLVVDSNITSPATYGPKAGYIGAKVCNAGDAPLAGVILNLGDYDPVTPANSTPGIFPPWSSAGDPRPFIADTGSYALTIEADETGAADGARYLGSLAAGACRMQYWLFSYPQCVNVDPDGAGPVPPGPDYPPCAKSIAGGVKPDDDVRLEYDVWATTTTGGVALAAVTKSFTLRNEISASANKIWPNTTSKVPDEYLVAIESVLGWGTLGPDGQPLTAGNPVYPGQRVITTQGIWYDLGNVGAGFDNNGDLVPDQNAWLQPVGDPASFDADCFRLVKVYGIVIAKLKTGGELLIPFQDQLYFQNIPDNTGVVGLVYYQYIATGSGCVGSLTPYQEAASGFDNEKFSADYGLSLGLASGSYGSKLAFTKSDGVVAVGLGGTLTYTVTADNDPVGGGTGANLGAPDFGVPLVFSETIPAGTAYVGGSAAAGLAAPSGDGTYQQGYVDADDNFDGCTINFRFSSPASYVVTYSANGGASWSAAEPAPATAVTDIRWTLLTTLLLDGGHDGTACVAPDGSYDNGTLETSLPAGKSASLSFQVTVNNTAPFPGPVVCNTAGLGFGPADPAATARDCDVVAGNNTISGTVFKDDATGGGIYGNGVEDGTEAGIGAGVVVSLYYDANGDGVRDGGDLLYASAATAAAGTYSFTNVADGAFLVVVKKYDGAVSDGVSNAATDAAFGTAGWGNTTYDPNLPLTSDQGILKLGEDLTTAALAVNVDYNRDSGAQTVAGVDFGFAPPLRLTKSVQGNPDSPSVDGRADIPIDEGDTFSYAILLENRLPSVGRQGPTGCEYTVWASGGSTGSSNGNKNFVNATNVWDATSPNRTVGTALIEGGGKRWVYGTGYALAPQVGTITRVEALYFGYFDLPLTDDFLNLALGRATVSFGPDGIGGTNTATGTVGTPLIDNYIGSPASLEPSAAISWDITSLRPNPLGSAWQWADFPGLYLQVNPSKSANSDAKTFSLDAIGLRVTTDRDCEADASTTLSPVPLQDRYDTGSVAFVAADPPPTSIDTAAGVIRWDDVGPILPGTNRTVTVTVRALDVNGTRTGSCGAAPPPAANSACNWAETAWGGKNVSYADGRLANDASGKIAVQIVGKAELRGVVWRDTNLPAGDGWPYDAGEPYLPGASVSLYACVRSDGVTLETGTASNRTCTTIAGGNSWKKIATAGTDANGAYEFIGLDSGYYIIEVGDSNGAPVTGNASPFGGAQTAEPNDSQQPPTGGNATGTSGICAGAGGCNNTWGDPAAVLLGNQSTINLLAAGSEETVNGIDFGYYLGNAVIYGSVWHDIDGDATREAGEGGLSPFGVGLYTDADGDGLVEAGDTLVALATTDAAGGYAFSGLGAGSYVVVVAVPSRRPQAWVETVESTGGTTSLDNRIPVTVGAGALSGSHDFGYTLADTSDIGDTVWLDFDGDGIRDATEQGIPGITVRLFGDVDRDGRVDDGVDALIATDGTDALGNYLFAGLPAGSYVVQVDTADPDFPAGAAATGDPDLNAASIGDLVWLDADGDGVFDGGEKGIAGATVLLYADSDGSGTLVPGTDKVVAATVTNAYGTYLFTGLNAGRYFVDVDEATLPSPLLALTTADPAATLVTLAGRTVAAQVLTADAGYSLPANYALGGRIWSDADGDNVQDPGEVGVPGINLTVTNGTGTGCPSGCTAITGPDGHWFVAGAAGLTSGTFTVDVVNAGLPRNFTLTTGTDPRTVTVAAADLAAVDFGYRYNTDGNATTEDTGDPTSSITGRIYQDVNGNEAWDAGVDVGLTGTTVNLLDETGAIVATTLAGAGGTYAFTGVFVGSYSVQAVDEPGALTSVLFLSAGQTFPNLDVVYDASVTAAADSFAGVSVDGVHDDLNQDFGYQRFLGSIGDTVYQDANENGTQDLGEPGIGSVTVELSLCGWTDDGDGLYEDGEETGCAAPVATTTTTTDDPLTPADEGGKYLFSNLAAPGAGQYYIVEVVTSTLPGMPTLTADPDTDGAPCPVLPDPDDPGDEFPPFSVCDSRHLVPTFVEGTNYLGADFGYRVMGIGFATIGDRLWIDTNGNGLYDGGEPGVPWITVWFDTNGDGDLDWADGNGNGSWDAGEGERWVETDADGLYLFTGLADAVYRDLRVLNYPSDGDPDPELDPDWPPALPRLPTYEARATNTGSLDGLLPFIFVASGAMTVLDDGDAGNGTDTCRERSVTATTLAGSATVNSAGLFLPSDVGLLLSGPGLPEAAEVTAFVDASTISLGAPAAASTTDLHTLLRRCNFDADFGYRYPGGQTLAGTICTESGTLNGYCGDTATTHSGTGSGESPLAGIAVNLYRWSDGPVVGEAWDGATGALDADDTFTLLGSTSTDANGDYAFANVPTGKLVLVFGVSDTQNLRLTTTSANSSLEGGSSLQLYEGTGLYQGRAVTVLARQAITITGDVVDLDFAFDASLGGAITYDFGDLPDTAPDYGATLLADGGARHLVPASPAIYLGAGLSAEPDGKPSADAGLHPDVSGDTLDDGVVLEQFAESSDDGGVHYPGGILHVTASAAGWLAGWVDFNQDGDFADAGEMILDLAVSAGASRLTFDVPISLATVSPDFYARFRIYPSRPLMTSSTGAALDAAFATVAGEVEDYFWNLAVTPAIVSSFTACDAGGALALEWRTASGASSLGFLLRRWDEGRRAFVDAGGRLLPALIGSARGGVYRFLDAAASPDRPQQYELLEVEAMGRSTRHGPFDVDAAIPCDGEPPAGYAREAAPPSPQAAALPPAAAADGPLDLPETGPFAKIATTEEAVHYLDAGALARVLGISPEEARRNLRGNRYALSSGGQPVAFHPAGGHAGVWYFAQRQRSQFARENVYRMGPGDAGGLRMGVRDEDATGRRAGERTFPRVVREERDLLPGHAIFTDARRDHWLWDYLVGGEPPKSFAVRSDAVARDGGEAVLTLLFIGATDTEADPDHHALVRLNGTLIGEVRWNGLATREAAFAFDPALLADGENEVEIAALDDTAAPYSIFYLDSIALAYRSLYRATGDRLAFEAAGNRVLRITGFSTPDILLFDVTRPRRPVRVTAKAFADGEGGWGVSIAPRSPNGRYQALTREAAALPARVVADRPSRLRDRNRGARYLVVTTRELLGPARRLAAYRGGIVVDIEDIYDEFNHGVPSPFALRSFLDHAWHRWRVRPRYVLLAGDGTYDYRDNLGLGGNLIPPMMVGTAEGLFPSDAWFADVAGGPAPEMAIGRLPAASAAELDVLVDKTLLRESAADRAWIGRMLALADDADDAGDFPGESDRLTELVPPDVAVTRVHLGALPLAAARKALLGGINSGAGLVNYLGHAGFEILADEGLLRSGDVPLLANTGRPTVMTAMTCLAGDFSLPGAPGLAELLVRSGSGGAAAVWAPTGLSVNEPALRLAEGFYAAAFTGGDDVRIGDAVLAAQRGYERGHHAPQLLRLYVLLGDPAMRLR